MPQVYDNVFHTLMSDCRRMVIPLINETFGEHYRGDEKIESLTNEKVLHHANEPDEMRIADSNFAIYGERRKTYHWECQSTSDSSMIVRLFEYDILIARESRDVEGDILTAEFPHTAVLYLRNAGTMSDSYKYIIKTPGGDVSYSVPIVRMQNYNLEEIFDKDLIILLPYYIFIKEPEFKKYEREPERISDLQDDYRKIIERLDEMAERGKLTEFERTILLETAIDVIEEITTNHREIKERMGEVMNGTVIETRTKKIWNEGREEGREEGRKEGMEEGREELITNMYKNDLPLEKIAIIAKMSVDDIQAVIDKRNK